MNTHTDRAPPSHICNGFVRIEVNHRHWEQIASIRRYLYANTEKMPISIYRERGKEKNYMNHTNAWLAACGKHAKRAKGSDCWPLSLAENAWISKIRGLQEPKIIEKHKQKFLQLWIFPCISRLFKNFLKLKIWRKCERKNSIGTLEWKTSFIP